MKSIIIAIIFISSVSVFNVYPSSAFDKNGYEIVSEKKDNNTIFEVRDSKGEVFTVVYYSRNGIPKAIAKRVLYLKSYLDRFEVINNGKLRFNVTVSGIVDVAFAVTSLKYNDVEYAKFLPMGITMSYDGKNINYTVQALKGTNNFKIYGFYNREMDMVIDIAQALEDPRSYEEKYDPEYISAQLEYLTAELRHTQKMLILLSELKISKRGYYDTLSYINQIIIIKQNNKLMTYDEMTDYLKANNISVRKDLIITIFRVYFNDFELKGFNIPNPFSTP